MNRTRWITSFAATSAIALCATPGLAQDQDPEMEAMRLRLESVEQQLAEMEAEAEAADQRMEREDGVMFDVSRFTPGWERVRNENWMGHGRLEEMNVQIGQAGPIDLYLGLQTAGRLQYLNQSDVSIGGTSQPGALEPGFQTAWGSIDALADLYDGALEVYFDIYLSSMTSADKLQGHEGYMLMRRIPGTENTLVGDVFDIIDVKAGQFEIDFGDHRYRRSDNATSQRNPLVGNYIFDPKSTEIGMEVMNAEPGMINWLAGFGSGDETGGFASGRGISLHGKVWADLTDELRLSGSAYYVDHDAGTASSNMYRTSRGGGVYDGVLAGNAPGRVFVGNGTDVLAFQGDASWINDQFELYGHVGWVEDDTNAGGDDRWLYYAGEGVYRFTDRLYAAARYSGAAADRLQGNSSSGIVHRAQVGGGYWIYDTVLFKAEYVYQSYHNFSQDGGMVSGVDAWEDPSFNGVISEVSFSF